MPRCLALLVATAALFGCGDADAGGPASPSSGAGTRIAGAWLDTGDHPLHAALTRRRGGDLDAIRRSGYLRVLTSYSNTNYFITNGQQRGLEFELLRTYERFLNRQERAAGRPPIAVLFLPLPFDQLIPALLAGEGDVAAAGLTVTPARRRRVLFTNPYLKNVSEVVVRNKGAPPVPNLAALAGRTLQVVRGSSWAAHLRALAAAGTWKRAPRIREVDESLEAEDLLQMVHAGIYQYTVVDDHLARLWAEVLGDVVVEENARVAQHERLAWALRPHSSQLAQSMNAFIAQHRQGTLLGNTLFKRYFANVHWISNPTRLGEWKRLRPYEAAFRRYAGQYGFDWLELVALAYQESHLDPQARSRQGAVGLMQIRPTTARDPHIDIANVESDPEANIHAGTRYLAFLRDRYFTSPAISARDRLDFALAAYNAGPARINRLRHLAVQQGLDGNRWFGHVEHVARREIGPETVTYVANVNRYYIAYRWMRELQQERAKARSKSVSRAPAAGRGMGGNSRADEPA